LPEGNGDQTRIAELERRVATLESVMREIGGLK
jgi:hypothetical protein